MRNTDYNMHFKSYDLIADEYKEILLDPDMEA
jgi:hypothetical protein